MPGVQVVTVPPVEPEPLEPLDPPAALVAPEPPVAAGLAPAPPPFVSDPQPLKPSRPKITGNSEKERCLMALTVLAKRTPRPRRARLTADSDAQRLAPRSTPKKASVSSPVRKILQIPDVKDYPVRKITGVRKTAPQVARAEHRAS